MESIHRTSIAIECFVVPSLHGYVLASHVRDKGESLVNYLLRGLAGTFFIGLQLWTVFC